MSKQTQKVYVVISNTDLTEGRGHPLPIHVCKIEATARRLAEKKGVMGSPANIQSFESHFESGWWYGPVYIVSPSKDDERIQALTDTRNAAIEKAKAAGLSDEIIAAITGQRP